MGEELLEEGVNSRDMYMTFKTGDEYFGISINHVNEIVGMQPITKVPEVENYIRGLINLRGKIIPVIDVRMRFQLEPLPYTDRTCIIVINVKNTVVGLIVEKIDEVITVNKDNIIPPPSLSHSKNDSNRYVCGLAKTEDSVKLLLDPERLIRDEELAALKEEQ